jgi:hypothetical protein
MGKWPVIPAQVSVPLGVCVGADPLPLMDVEVDRSSAASWGFYNRRHPSRSLLFIQTLFAFRLATIRVSLMRPSATRMFIRHCWQRSLSMPACSAP